jgi:hypothetical protein
MTIDRDRSYDIDRELELAGASHEITLNFEK